MPPSVEVSNAVSRIGVIPAAGAAEAVRPRSRHLVALFSATLFLSAFLMFLVEPMIARMILPLLGGAAAVWNTCLVFFQALLLCGYAYAHGATTWLGVRRHAAVHAVVILLPLLVLPIALTSKTPPAAENPVGWLLLALLTSIGLPFLVLSTSAAVLQKWYSASGSEGAHDPYFLYSASNLGSFVALIAYPLIVEPTLRLQQQAQLWTVGYVALVGLTLVCAASVWRRGAASEAHRIERSVPISAEPLSWMRRWRWTALAFVPSSLLLAVTSYMSTDVASVPLLWIVPLSLYLLTFIIAFSRSATAVRAVAARLTPLAIIVLTLVLVSQMGQPLSVVLVLHLAVFTIVALCCHAELAHDRPSPARLTEFYFWIALGGMLGGLFNALVAPIIFVGIAEYPLVLIAACLLRPVASSEGRQFSYKDVVIPVAIGGLAAASIVLNNRLGSLSRLIILGATPAALLAFSQKQHRIRFAAAVALILIAGTLSQSQFGRVVYAARTFFGVYRVRLDVAHGYRFIFHGTTLHGMQSLDGKRSSDPVSYFHRSGPVGQVFAAAPQARLASDVAVVGLGVGTLATYKTPSQRWTFYEIDPIVERIARNEDQFTYLKSCGDRCTVVTGDGRMSLARAEPHKFGIIVLDAFSSDAVPMHLMTKEAMSLYLSKLAPGGVIVFNISNIHLTFQNVLARIAADAGLVWLWQRESPEAGSWEQGKFPSEWFVAAREWTDLGRLTTDFRWMSPQPVSGTPLWTDDFSNILSVLKH